MRSGRRVGAIVKQEGGEETGLGVGVLDDPATGILWLAHRLARYGQGLAAGDIVLSGSFIRPIEAPQGSSFAADFGSFGHVAISFAREVSMPAPVNALKARLAAGETLYGCWLGTGEAYLAEMAASSGFDWLLIDGEHAPNDIRSLSAQLMAVLGRGSEPVVRLVNGDAAKIKQVLDIGAQNLLIPMVESAAQAEAILRATRYPPQGFRGVGSSMARAAQFGAVKDYLATANDQICLIVQVESRAGLAALDGILAIEGVDGVFIGPSDLAADMGHLGRPDHPEVKAAVFDALARIRAAGRVAGVMATDPVFVDECRRAGANFLGVGVDVLLYVDAMRSLAAHYQS